MTTRKFKRRIITYRVVEKEIKALKNENYVSEQEDHYKQLYKAATNQNFVPARSERFLPHYRNNAYRLIRLVEKMIDDGKNAEKDQEKMFVRQETYEKRLKIQYQDQYDMQNTEPDSYVKHFLKLARGMSEEIIQNSNVSEAEKEICRSITGMVEPAVGNEQNVQNVEIAL